MPDISQFLTDTFLDDHPEDDPIIISGLSHKYDIIIFVRKKEDNK